MKYSCTLEAFRDLIIGMNQGATFRSYTFRESNKYCRRARIFKKMTQSITKRPLHVRRETNKVEVRFYE